MKPVPALLRLFLWSAGILALGYAFAKTQGGFSGWFLFTAAAAILVYEWSVALAGMAGWRVEVKPEREEMWEGDAVEVEIAWRRPWWGWFVWAHVSTPVPEVRLTLPPGAGTGKKRLACAEISRGRYPLSPVTLELSDFFGLYHVRREMEGGPVLRVYPRPLVDGSWPLRHRGAGSRAVAGPGARPGMVPRPYRPGDRLHWIHWRATAARGTLYAREAESGEGVRRIVCLDLRSGAYGGASGDFETALRLAAALAIAEGGGAPLCGMWTTEGWWAPVKAGVPLWPAVRDRLADARWTGEGAPGAGGSGRAVPDRAIREVQVHPGDDVRVLTGVEGAREWEKVRNLWTARGARVALYAVRSGRPDPGTEGREGDLR